MCTNLRVTNDKQLHLCTNFIHQIREGQWSALEGVGFYIEFLYLSLSFPPCPAPQSFGWRGCSFLGDTLSCLPRKVRAPHTSSRGHGAGPSLPFVWEKGSVISGRRISTGFTLGPDLGVPPTAELSESGRQWHFPDRISETLSSSALNEAQSRFIPFQVGREESFCSSTAMKIFPWDAWVTSEGGEKALTQPSVMGLLWQGSEYTAGPTVSWET